MQSLLVIAGPTGVGKTAAAVALGRGLPIEVISADSRQVYRSMDAATGKPSAEERRAVPHHLIDVVEPDDRYHAARFLREARALIEAVHARGRLPAIVGGTGLYIRALMEEYAEISSAPDPQLRSELMERDVDSLREELRSLAPAVADSIDIANPLRVRRALEKLLSPSASRQCCKRRKARCSREYFL